MAHINIYSNEVGSGFTVSLATVEHPEAGTLQKFQMTFESGTVLSFFAKSLTELEDLFDESLQEVIQKAMKEETLSGAASQ